MTLTKVGKVFHAKIRTAAGKQKSITTRTTNRREAEKVVKESGIKDLELAAKSGRLTTEAIGMITTGRKLTVSKCVRVFEDWMRNRGHSPRTINRHITTIENWMRDSKVENLPPSAVTEKQIADWVNRKSDAGYLTKVSYLSSLRSLFACLCAKGWVATDPSQSVGIDRSKLSHKQKEPRRREAFNEMEITRLMTYLEKHGDIFWLFAVKLSRLTGLRLSDIAQLEWQSFSDVPGKIVVHTGKTSKRIEQPMTPELEELLTQIPVDDAKYLFPDQRTTSLSVSRRSYLSVQFGRLCAKAGVSGKSFHGLRHTAATETAKGGDKEALVRKLVETLSLKEAQALLGHQSSETTKRYLH